MGAGVVGGLAYNSSQTKVIPVVDEVKKELKPALKSDAFVPLEVSWLIAYISVLI